MKTKNKNKNKNKSNKAVIIVAIVSAAVVLALLFVLIFADILAGRAALSRVREGISGSDAVLISDPSYHYSIVPTSAEVVLTGEDARNMADTALKLTDKARFHTVKVSSAGYWDISMRFDDTEHSYTVYLESDHIYVVKNDKG